MVFKLINLVMALLFLLSVVVQFNDPDPLLWIAIYALCAVACLLVFTEYKHWIFPALVATLAIVWVISLVPSLYPHLADINWREVLGSVEMKSTQTEIVREIGGLLIAAAWMILIAIKSKQ